MKNIVLLIAFTISFIVIAMGSTKNGNDDALKQRMKVDAYAKANIECEYKLTKLEYMESDGDRALKIKLSGLKTDLDKFRQKMFKRYSDEDDLNAVFTKLVKSLSDELTTCKKLTALQESIADAKAAALKAAEEKAKDGKKQ